MSKFHERLVELGFATYAEYLESPHWKAFRLKYRDSGKPMSCAVCGTKPIQLHHHTYVRLGCESLDDVTPLCRPHHEAVHAWLKESGRVFVAYTWEAVASLAGVPSVKPVRVKPVREKAKGKKRGRPKSSTKKSPKEVRAEKKIVLIKKRKRKYTQAAINGAKFRLMSLPRTKKQDAAIDRMVCEWDLPCLLAFYKHLVDCSRLRTG